MINLEYNAGGALVQVHTDFSYTPAEMTRIRDAGNHIVNRNDFNSLTDAEVAAQDATALTGTTYIATDAGGYVSPRFDVKRLPQVGDQVSYSFNGDSYPDGEIKAISPTLKVITTTTGGRYHRRGQTGSWVKGGTWSLVQGHHNKRNPSF